MLRFVQAVGRGRAGNRGLVRGGGLIAMALVAVLVATACGGSSRTGTKIAWQPGTPPPNLALRDNAPASDTNTAPQPTVSQLQEPAGTIAVVERPTPVQPAGIAPGATTTGASAAPLTAAQLAELTPNELGLIPIVEYHQFVTDASQEEQYVRPIKDFRQDLQWFYDHDFYVVPLRDVFLNRIAAPAGKHPLALTFDDSTAGQFRYLQGNDGELVIDPDSAVAVLETFYKEHPDFGSGGHFAALPTMCFNWQGEEAEPDQDEYCGQKLQWLLDHGYEIGNHTLNHTNLFDLDDETFKAEVGGACIALREFAPQAQCDILTIPFGTYPNYKTHRQQWDWIENGFDYEGISIKFLGALMVGSEPAASPVSINTEWTPVETPRIQAFDGTYGENKDPGLTKQWLPIFEQSPDILYTSDGDPNTITVPNELPPALDGTFDEARAERDGKQVIRYGLPLAGE